ncbi:MAG TPA: MBL fold metallo-hydrolase [Burkholderiales bacterium]|nr:MBL fold metallo-hydrolase [Burkholderiales bacterium]
MTRRWLALLLALAPLSAQAQSCPGERLQIQILGSGAGGLSEGRAAPSVLVWIDGKPRLMVDAGPGAAMRFVRANATFQDLDAILLTHLHTNRTADLPALVQLMSSRPRARPLHIYGPSASRWTPSTVSFVRSLFDPTRGAWRHLGELLSPLTRSPYRLEPHDVRLPPAKIGVAREKREQPVTVPVNEHARVTALPLNYGQTTSLAWRIESQGKHVVLSANVTVEPEALERFAKGADMLVTSHAIVDDSALIKTAPVLAPAAVARLAQTSGVRTIVLMSRTGETLAQESEAESLMRRHYEGQVRFADDLDCITP